MPYDHHATLWHSTNASTNGSHFERCTVGKGLTADRSPTANYRYHARKLHSLIVYHNLYDLIRH